MRHINSGGGCGDSGGAFDNEHEQQYATIDFDRRPSAIEADCERVGIEGQIPSGYIYVRKTYPKWSGFLDS